VKKVGLKTDLLEAELGKVKKEIAVREDTYVFLPHFLGPDETKYLCRFRQSEKRAMVLQERSDAQAITLRLAKEHSGDLQVVVTFLLV
jgi:hypothetical protein